MLKTVEGIYRDGKVELLEKPGDVEEARVIVTFMPTTSGVVNLPSRGIDQEQAANLRDRLGRFAQDWERSDMAAYDDL
ncbi:MAG TPA: hypothetical protein IGS52_01220 [Oscillatoriaceae cyanobacterium M33_DOE_052]|uniref:Uncharacterized protein n=1 Tax=Planktothricoides sp. SpSt-374 TaxID=2282167 RepID=A0A7C3VSU7_9CYAN|nr:hypothetical protein [Oscillatoriaceae cyanobacterium M33_DOE_052]